jgi:putative inorganic carbon (hco3(-)) transporter
MPPDSRPADVKFGVLEYGFWAFLIIAIGRVGELLGTSLPLVKITLALPIIIRVARWKSLPRLSVSATPLARTAGWLIVLAVLVTPTSVWPGKSVIFLTQDVPVLIATTSLAYVMSRSWRSVRGTLLALVLSGLILARAALSGYSGGRASTATMYDPNDLAYLLVTLLPLAIGFVITSKATLWRMIYAGVAAVLLIGLLLTQSRGGLLGLIAVGAFMILAPIRAPEKDAWVAAKKRRIRIAAVFAVLCLSVVIWSQLPQDAQQRFATLLDLSHDYNLDPDDPTARGQIWNRGVRATIARPLGYGPESFAMVDWKFGGRFFAPHNSYLEVAVELGVVGLILFLRMYVLAWRGLKRIRTTLMARESLSHEQGEVLTFARLLQFSLVGNAVAGFFLSMAYASVLWTIFGICMAVMALNDAMPSSSEPQSKSYGQ